MSIDLSKMLRDKVKQSGTKSDAATSFDRPASFHGFRKILKSDSLGNDPARRGFAGNSAFSTRLMGGRLW